jgi:type I restriction-modification system DNA methylase subunit
MQNEARETIKKLVEKYEAEKAAGKIDKYSEEETKRGFIEPLFEALGWNFSSKQEITLEEQISGDRVDYGFYLNGRIKFYLEAKKMSVDLHREEFAKQAIRYSWNKGVTWAVLTDFEDLIVFNALSPEKSLAGKKYLSFTYQEYLTRFDELWRLSKEGFGNDALDKEAEKVGKKLQKVSVTEKLAEDLNRCRGLLTKAFVEWNEKVPKNLIDEGVQKLLDRLIFIRVAEDRKIEPETLMPLLHQWKSGGNMGQSSPYQAMVEKFRELDKIYNSNLFSPHPFEQWEEFSGATEKVIDILYGDKDYFQYDFSAIPADVLGAVYENYLGYKLEQSKKKDADLAQDHRKRKEQGIYYTPKFIVDYIVENALGPVLDKCKTIGDLQKIKVLDPACGSGSFLVAAMNFLIKKYEDFGAKSDGYLKIQILQNNIYGVDLDQQAVELARLNLLLNTFDAQTKLPNLGNNIKCGNSLISGTDEELEKYFGKNFRDKKPFNWPEELPEVFKQGGFDCVIGNPPYIDSEEMTKSQPDFRDYSVEKFTTAKGNWDLFCIFIELGVNVLKKGGDLGMIVPNKLISASYAAAIRNLLSTNSVLALADYSSIAVFGASVYPVVVIVEKGEDKNHGIEITVNHGIDSPTHSSKQIFPWNSLSEYKDGWASLFEEREGLGFLDRITHEFNKLEEIKIFSVTGAATVSEAYEIKKIIREINSGKNDDFKFINTGTIDRYRSLWEIEPTRYIKDSYKQPSLPKIEFKKKFPKRYEQSGSSKIIIGGMSKFLECFLDRDGKYVAGKSTTIILGENLDSLKILLGILNSKLLSIFYSRVFKSLSLAGGYFRIGAPQVKLLPINMPTGQATKNLVTLVDKMIGLQEQLGIVEENSNEWQKINDEIAKTDQKIDQAVYRLYGLTEEEIKILESLID